MKRKQIAKVDSSGVLNKRLFFVSGKKSFFANGINYSQPTLGVRRKLQIRFALLLLISFAASWNVRDDFAPHHVNQHRSPAK